jgi:hypothetical protein
MLHVRLDSVGLGGGRDSVESGFKGQASDDTVREMRKGAGGFGRERIGFVNESGCGRFFIRNDR